MPDSHVSGDIRLLDDLTRLKLRVIQKKLSKRGNDVITPTKYRRREITPTRYRRRPRTPESEYTYDSLPPTPIYDRRRDKFHRRIDKRHEILEKLWEELGDDPHHRRHHHRYLPPLQRPDTYSRMFHQPVVAVNSGVWEKTGNTKKDLMELMLIQNAQLQQWMMTQNLTKHGHDDGVHHHYHGNGRFPPIKGVDAEQQYPQDFFKNDVGTSAGKETAAKSPTKKKR